jgi:hypothetical protein
MYEQLVRWVHSGGWKLEYPFLVRADLEAAMADLRAGMDPEQVRRRLRYWNSGYRCDSPSFRGGERP